VTGDGGLAGLRRRLAELRAELENPRPKSNRRRGGRRGKQRASERDSVRVQPSAGAGGRAFSAAKDSLDGSDDLPPYRLVREDGSVREVQANDRDVGPYARRGSTGDGA